MTHELRLNKSAHSDAQIKEKLAAHIELHNLQGLEMEDAGDESEFIGRWSKPIAVHTCGIHHDETGVE